VFATLRLRSQGVVAQRAARDDFDAALIHRWGHHDLAARSVDALHPPQQKVKLCQRACASIELVRVNIHASGGHLVQERLPQMGFVLSTRVHGGVSSASEAIPRPGREFKPSGAAADDNDAMGIGHEFGWPGNADMIFVPDYA